MARRSSPKILNVSWGRMAVEGLGEGRDFKLWPGGGQRWDWAETDTHHDPGIQAADVEELLAHGADVIVLSRGMELRLKTSSAALEFLQERGVDVSVDETVAAVERYNGLVERGLRVGGHFHSTC